ncbi:MAG: sensor histidine kinase [Planctomycetes bacterium]|nr:sensor histidine kinase [Planctomycetota bacterium]
MPVVQLYCAGCCGAATQLGVMHMKNGLIEKAIEEFKNRRLGVYKADPDQIVRDTRVAERATKDHVGRWLFELLQNSDDAEASEVRIIIDEGTIYVADNGRGIKPVAVIAICGTDFSDKTTGTIGRKGVGFKSVYEVSQNPQVLTVDGEGIEFSPEKTKAWLRENNLNEGHVPYQWFPFFIPWDNAQTQDPQLRHLKEKLFKTVVRLPGLSPKKKQKVEQLLREWPPHALFAFRHLRQIKAPGLEVVLNAGDGTWSLRDNRVQTPVEWRVARHTERPPADLIELLEEDERQAVSTDGVGFLIAAPLENACVVPTTDYLPVHVFYTDRAERPGASSPSRRVHSQERPNRYHAHGRQPLQRMGCRQSRLPCLQLRQRFIPSRIAKQSCRPACAVWGESISSGCRWPLATHS